MLAILMCASGENGETQIPTRYFQLDSLGYFYRTQAKESFTFLARQSFPSLPPMTRHEVQHEGYVCYIEKSNETAGFCFCDKVNPNSQDYPKRIAFQFLQKSLQVFKENSGQKVRTL